MVEVPHRTLSTKGPSWGYPRGRFWDLGTVLEPFFRGTVAKSRETCQELTFEIPPRRALRGHSIHVTKQGLPGVYRGTSLIRNSNPPPGPLQDPGYSPTVESYEGGVSCERYCSGCDPLPVNPQPFTPSPFQSVSPNPSTPEPFQCSSDLLEKAPLENGQHRNPHGAGLQSFWEHNPCRTTLPQSLWSSYTGLHPLSRGPRGGGGSGLCPVGFTDYSQVEMLGWWNQAVDFGLSHESRRCSRDTYPESYITKYTSTRRKNLEPTKLMETCNNLPERAPPEGDRKPLTKGRSPPAEKITSGGAS